jgi:two-component system, cell cycle sensor histidine kinase and response regulator CckA
MRVGGKAGGESAAAAVERRFERVLDHLRAMLVEFDASGRISYVSASVSEILGYLPEEIRELRRFEWIHAEDVAQILELSRKLASTGESAEAVYRARHKQGRWLWLQMAATSHVMPDGGTRTLAFVHDVTQARQAGRAQRITEDRFQAMAENAADLLSEIDGTGRFVYVSPNCQSLLGTPADAYVGQTVASMISQERLHPDDRAAIEQAFIPRVASGGEAQVEYRYRHADGSWRWFETRGRGYRTQGGELRVLLISRDVTERARIHQALRVSEERYRMLAETTHDLVIELDAEGKIVYVSPNSLPLLGYAPGEMVGTLPFALLHPDDVERLAESFLNRVSSSAPRRMGTQLRVRHRDGSWRWLEGGGVNYRTASGEMHVVGVVRDITEQRRVEDERRRLEDWIRQAQKLESLGLMAGGIAHDFNNLLTPILGDASLALIDLPPDSDVRPRMERIQKAAQRAAMLTNQLLDYAGRGSLMTEPLDLSRLVSELGELLELTVARKAELQLRLPPDLPRVQADGTQLSQVVMNLITNAAEATSGPGGRIDVATGVVSASRADLERMLLGEELREGPYVFVEVADTGCGMTPETRARIFDPFFTTKFTGRGLGLAAVLGIVRAHRGAIEIASEPGRGTRFRVLFPACPRVERSAPTQSAAEPRTALRGKLLVVDDDPGVLEVTSETLARAGFEVLRAQDGAAALASFQQHADGIRAVLLDLNMPGASGEDTFDAIRRVRPDVKIVLISGYSQDRAAFARPARASFLQKPFLPGALLATVRALLES